MTLAAACLGIETVAINPTDDPTSIHVRRATTSAQLTGGSAATCLDIDQIVETALQAGGSAAHRLSLAQRERCLTRALEQAGQPLAVLYHGRSAARRTRSSDLEASPVPERRHGSKREFIDTW